MLWTLVTMLMLLWAIGLAANYTIGGFIHVLLFLALVVVFINIIHGQRPIR